MTTETRLNYTLKVVDGLNGQRGWQIEAKNVLRGFGYCSICKDHLKEGFLCTFWNKIKCRNCDTKGFCSRAMIRNAASHEHYRVIQWKEKETKKK